MSHHAEHDCSHSHAQNGHSHHHHHHQVDEGTLNKAFKLGIFLNVAFVIAEATFGILYNSMGLLSDAGHNLSDVVALVLSLVAFRLMKKSPDMSHTYGYRKFSIQASLFNAILLLVAVGVILAESIEKLIKPVAVDGDAIAWIAGAGVIINGITAWLFLKDKEKDLNVKGAFLHMLGDTLISVGVLASGVVIRFTEWYWIDPVIGIAIAILIAWSTKSLLTESFRLSIDSVPAGVDMPKLIDELKRVPEVTNIHHLHVWALSTTENAMTVHAVIENKENLDATIINIRKVGETFNISHSTIEVETGNLDCHCINDVIQA